MELSRIGVTGLAVMGANLARNIARHGVPVAVHNRTTARTKEFMDGLRRTRARSRRPSPLEDFVAALEQPRADHRDGQGGRAGGRGDRGARPAARRGRHHHRRGQLALRRHQAAHARSAPRNGLRFIGIGVSGGEEGALQRAEHHARRRPGGLRRGRGRCSTRSRPRSTARRAACTSGPDGAGHYVKMVHNGIEYADMQLIAEAYDLLTPRRRARRAGDRRDLRGVERRRPGVVPHRDHRRACCARPTPAPASRSSTSILDQAEQKGTGRWTVQDALDLGVPITGITEAVFARALSSVRDEREAAPRGARRGRGRARRRAGRPRRRRPAGAVRVEDRRVRAGVRRRCAAASQAYGWDIDLGAMATIWRGGCIIRARFLDRIREAYDEHGDVAEPADGALLHRGGRRGAGRLAARGGRRRPSRASPIPAFSRSLAYYDGYRRERGPANLIQGLRDYFGAHTYRRIDGDGSYHTRWAAGRRGGAHRRLTLTRASGRSSRTGNGCCVVKVPVTGGWHGAPTPPASYPQAFRAASGWARVGP